MTVTLQRHSSSWNKQEIALFLKKARFVLRHPALDIRRAPRLKEKAHILIITPRVVGNAVQRNRIRRRIKALFYENKWYTSEYDWLIYTKKPLVQLSFNELSTLLNPAFTAQPTV